ncbi:THO complex subunit 4A-like [Mangifera indica]|uniref:THO complex subunit 4A-like n=1 Tax=Mangifera indica TaxID=29780 RepID=UPI001CFB7431|nr:THO complex subunit 4A-like [Mangifera indica]
MSSALDMSLDDIIKKNKKSGSGNLRCRGRRSGPGPARRFSNLGANRAAPYATTKAPETTWQHDMFTDQGTAFPAQQASRASAIETETKLCISNLEYGVSNEDIKELFSEVGDLKRYSVHYDRIGRSKGTAEVVFSRRADAMAAVKRYNNVQLDGKPMKIEIVGMDITTPATPSAANGNVINSKGFSRGGQGRGGAFRRPRGGVGGGRGFGRGRGRERGHNEKISADDLDADLDKYYSEASEAMQTS